MSIDLTKSVSHSAYDSFKNKNLYKGTLMISGSTSSGTNTRTFTITLDETPDILDIIFSDFLISGWSKVKYISVPTDNAGGGSPSIWTISTEVSGLTVTVTATYVKTFLTDEILIPTDFYYRIVDYLVF